MVKVFSKEKFEEARIREGDKNPSVWTWSDECDGKTAQWMNKNGYITHSVWMIEISWPKLLVMRIAKIFKRR